MCCTLILGELTSFLLVDKSGRKPLLWHKLSVAIVLLATNVDPSIRVAANIWKVLRFHSSCQMPFVVAVKSWCGCRSCCMIHLLVVPYFICFLRVSFVQCVRNYVRSSRQICTLTVLVVDRKFLLFVIRLLISAFWNKLSLNCSLFVALPLCNDWLLFVFRVAASPASSPEESMTVHLRWSIHYCNMHYHPLKIVGNARFITVRYTLPVVCIRHVQLHALQAS